MENHARKLCFSFLRVFKDECIKRVQYFGTAPLCNLQKDRAPVIHGFCFPLCWRCTSILITYIIFSLLIRNEIFVIPVKLITCFILQAPILVDGLAQTIFSHESTNFRRVITGFCSGMGISYLQNHISLYI